MLNEKIRIEVIFIISVLFFKIRIFICIAYIER